MAFRFSFLKCVVGVIAAIVALLAFVLLRPSDCSSVVTPASQMVPSKSERTFKGLIICGFMWDVYVANLDDLRIPRKRYWLTFDRASFKENHIHSQLRKCGLEIDWPTRSSEATIVRAEFTAEMNPERDWKGPIPEIDNELLVKRIVSYSRFSETK